MFLVMLRPHMVPDPSLLRLCDVTIQALKEEYDDKDNKETTKSCCAARKRKLAEILHSKEKSKSLVNSDDNSRRLISDAARLAIALQDVKPKHMKDVVELIFDVWVDKLLYASIRCTRESHARQLGRGGELITIVWIVAEHAGLFPIGEKIYDEPPKRPDNDDVDPNKTCCQKNLDEEPEWPYFCCEKGHYC